MVRYEPSGSSRYSRPSGPLLAVLEGSGPEPAGRVDGTVVESAGLAIVFRVAEQLSPAGIEIDEVPTGPQTSHENIRVCGETQAAHLYAQMGHSWRRGILRLAEHVAGDDVDPMQGAGAGIPQRAFTEPMAIRG